jgi:flagellar basal body-associated protein FliL
MSDDKKEPAAEAAKKPGGGGPSIVGLLLTAVLAGGASFGGAKFGAGTAHAAPATTVIVHEVPKPPGPTMALEPFIVTFQDEAGKNHAMKATIALELGHAAKEEEFKAFVPRVRDATLTYLRGLKPEEAQGKNLDKIRGELKEKLEKLGAEVERVLITDFVVQ